jgi:voltage-gated potassium channel
MNPPPAEPITPAAAADTNGYPSARTGVLRFSTAGFLAALALFFLILPFLEEFEYGDIIESGLITLMFSLAVLAVGRSPSTLVWALVLLIPLIICKWATHLWPGFVPPEIFPLGGMLFVGFLVANFLHFIMRSRRVDSEVLCAGISSYMLLGLFWMFAYLLVALLAPDAFAFSTGPDSSHSMTRFTAYYFSFTTLSTLGYGDITPLSRGARSLAVAEAMTGTLYVAVLISRLVSLYSSQSHSVSAGEPARTDHPAASPARSPATSDSKAS